MYILISVFLAYAIGIISYEYGFFIYLFIALFVALIYNFITTKKIIYNLVIITFLILGLINCNYNSNYVLKQYINEETEKTEFIAKIKNQNKITPESNFISYQASVIGINNEILAEEENTIIYFNKKNYVKENSIIRFSGSISDSTFSKNKMLFNYSNYLRSNKIGAVIFADDSIHIIKENYSFLNTISIKFRDYVKETFYGALNSNNAEVILSIILGDVDYLDDGFYDNIKIMGLAHIFAVSGSHIVLMYGFMLTAFKFCGLSHKISWVVTWGLIWIYGFLIGFPLSVMRTLVMFTLLFGSEMFYRKYSSLNSIGLAALVLALYNPYWIFDAGFLLSFSAALSLILYNKYILKTIKTENPLLRSIYLYLFLQLFTLPVLAYYFNYIPVMGILYNLLLLPIFTVILIYGFLLLIFNVFFTSILIIPFKIFNYLLYSLRYIINFTEDFAFNGITVPTLSFGMIFFFYIMVFIVLYLCNNNNNNIKNYIFKAHLSFYILNFVMIPLNDNSVYFNVIDAGQGLFTTLQYKNTNFVFDSGSTSSSKFGEYITVPYLTKLGVRNVDGFFISHWDEDHYSGLNELLNSHIEVKKIFSSSNNEELRRNLTLLYKGSNLILDDALKVNILWPAKSLNANSKNNSSLVVLINFNNNTIMLPGDIEKDAENMLIGALGKVNILIVPHHGSKTSSSNDFVEKVSPDISVFSYGKNNYGIPSEEVILRYEKEKSKILTTFNHGEINFILKGDKIYYNTFTGIKSENYYELYLYGILYNLMNFCILLYCMVMEKKSIIKSL